MPTTHWRSRAPRLFARFAPACLLLTLGLLVSACSNTATVTVGGAPPNGTTTSGLPTATTSGTASATTSSGATATATNTPSLPPPAIADYFVWTATPANISSNYTTIDNPNTNNNSNAILIVTPRWPPHDIYDSSPLGVWYSGGHWTIFQEDGSAMPANASFNVKVFAPGSGAFQWTATSTSISDNLTKIPSSLLPGGSSSVLLITPVLNPHNIYNNHPTGTWWNGSNWTVFNERASIAASAPMNVNAAFNVVAVSGFGGTVYTQIANSGNIDTDYTVTSGNSATDGHPNAVVECSSRWDSSTSVYVNHTIGVFYTSGHWAIFNEDQASMPVNATFNCAVYGS